MRLRKYEVLTKIVHCVLQTHLREIHILLAVVKYKTKLFIPRLGLCSNWLASMKTGEQFKLNVKKGSFTLPSSEVSSLIVKFNIFLYIHIQYT